MANQRAPTGRISRPGFPSLFSPRLPLTHSAATKTIAPRCTATGHCTVLYGRALRSAAVSNALARARLHFAAYLRLFVVVRGVDAAAGLEAALCRC